MKNNNFRISTHRLAEICGVSQGTVDRALNNRPGISDKTKSKIIEIAKSYGYIDDTNEKPRLIGIVMFDLYNEYFSELIMYLEHEFKKSGYSIVVMFTDKSIAKERQCLRELYYMGVDGIVICPVGDGDEFSNYLSSFNIPIVTVGNRVKDISYVGIDNFRAMYDACTHMAKRCHSLFYYAPKLDSDENIDAQRERYNGFVTAAEERGIDYRVVHSIDELIHEKSEKLAVMCSTDYYLMKVCQAFPDADVMGFDNISAVRLCRSGIETIDGNSVGVAKAVASRILNAKKGDTILEHRIISV